MLSAERIASEWQADRWTDGQTDVWALKTKFWISSIDIRDSKEFGSNSNKNKNETTILSICEKQHF